MSVNLPTHRAFSRFDGPATCTRHTSQVLEMTQLHFRSGSEALSTSRGKPAGVSDGNWIQTIPGKGWNTILRPYSPLEFYAASSEAWPLRRSPIL